jgi:predicted Fe-Mo cluster-binding NifX family protein
MPVMGMGAYESMKQQSIKPIVTDIVSISEVVKAYMDGKMVNNEERLQ